MRGLPRGDGLRSVDGLTSVGEGRRVLEVGNIAGACVLPSAFLSSSLFFPRPSMLRFALARRFWSSAVVMSSLGRLDAGFSMVLIECLVG